MLIKILKDGEVYESDVVCTDIKSCMNMVGLHHGKGLVDDILHNKYKFVVGRGDDDSSFTALAPEVAFADLSGYDRMYVLQDVGGEIQAAAFAAFVGASVTAGGVVTGTTAAVIAAYALAAIANLAIAFAISALMSLISPTPEFNSDPAAAQQSNTSNLFNGGILTTEAGGSVPYIFGRPFFSGVVISSSVETVDA